MCKIDLLMFQDIKSTWKSKMYTLLCLIICFGCVWADESEERRSKLPYIADAVGNSLPRPSNGPATVGSPVNLLTPDRYEFYTFDESGELVKRLMTLEEIQAIVAAGEDADGLVTFANENQPTIAFNFSQPPYTKVNSVVTNVQNVLKAQMEAHRNNPQMQPTLDTPDVSDSWSLILPSIFGNTGVDIVPDKSSGSFITPETETIEVDNLNGDYLYTFSKEANGPSQSSIAPADLNTKISGINEIKNTKTTSVFQQSTTHPSTIHLETKPVTKKPSTVNYKVTTEKITTSTTTTKPLTMSVTTVKPHSSTLSYSEKYSTKPEVAITLPSTNYDINTQKNSQNNVEGNVNNKLTTKKFTQTTTETLEDKFIPVSTVSYVTYKSTSKSTSATTKPTILSTTISDTKLLTNLLLSSASEKNNLANKPQASSTELSSLNKDENDYKDNSTTITTQSVSPSTFPSSTEVIMSEKYPQQSNMINSQTQNDNTPLEADEPIMPLFDVAQSISQIASDLGNHFAPLPTTTNILDTTQQNNINLESKENIEIDIPQEIEKINTEKPENNSTIDNYVKVTTLDANKNIENKKQQNTEKVDNFTEENDKGTSITETNFQTEVTTDANLIESTTIDIIISDSMGDLLSQIVYQSNNIVSSTQEINKSNDEKQADKNPIPIFNNKSEESEKQTEAPIEIITDISANISPEMTSNNDEDIISLTTEQPKTTHKSYVISTTERIYKNNDVPEFIPISISTYTNGTRTEIFKIPESESIGDKTILKTEINHQSNLEQKNLINSHTLLSKQNLENTTVAISKIETTTPVVNEKTSISKENKINTPDMNKIQKEKTPAELPKIDEFKKKIQKINIDDKELANERNSSWKLIPTVPPPKAHIEISTKFKPEGFYTAENNYNKHITLDFSKENQGLEVTTKDLGEDISQFVELSNELAFQYWSDITENIDKKRSFVISPYAITSMLAMMFMGARGATSGEMNEILKLDDMVTFNPHFILKNISDSIDISPASGVAISAFIRELYSDRSKGKILTFYKERAQQFYNGHVEEINFKLISDVIRRRTNLLVKRYTMGKITEYMKTNAIIMQPPLAAFTLNIFETDCTGSSVEGRDGEMYFVVSPNVRQRRLVPVPAVVYRVNFLAGYDPVLDATAAALGNTNSIISTLFLMPGQQGNIVHGEDLEALEKRLLASNPAPAWNRILRTLLPRVGLELQIPRFSHKSIFNVSSSLRKMGLKDLFDQEHADLGGLNGPSKNLFLSDMVQLNSFVTCGENVVSEQHHVEEYPESLDIEKIQRRRSARWLNWDEPRDYQRAFHDPHDVGEAMHLPLHLRPRQARLPARNAQPARLKFDRPFLFFVRHNPSGMILYVGRYNPRLLP